MDLGHYVDLHHEVEDYRLSDVYKQGPVLYGSWLHRPNHAFHQQQHNSGGLPPQRHDLTQSRQFDRLQSLPYRFDYQRCINVGAGQRQGRLDLAQLQKVLDLKADQFLYQSQPCKSLGKYDVCKFQNKQFLS